MLMTNALLDALVRDLLLQLRSNSMSKRTDEPSLPLDKDTYAPTLEV